MSEQTIQNALYAESVSILDKYECLSLGNTTINDLIRNKVIWNTKISKKNSAKKPDVLILNKMRQIIIYQEQKMPQRLNSEKGILQAVEQEIDVARELRAKIYVVSDGERFIWINPLTKERIRNVDGHPVEMPVKPKENAKKLVSLINEILLSIDQSNNQILQKEYLDPKELAEKTNKILKHLTFASAKKCLYTFVEVFLFKYLSDINILTKENSFQYIYSLYQDHETDDATVLGKYIDGPRETMKMLCPEGEDGTGIINGQVFHVERDSLNNYVSVDNTDTVFRQVIVEFKKYELENGKFINISRDFKSKLFETFMKNSDERTNMGQFFTPLKVVQEMVNMVDIKEGMRICDPACGVGKFLLEAVEDNFDDFFYVDENGKLVQKVQIFGYDKMMAENDDITIILAKANMLIYFSKLFTENNNAAQVQQLSKQLLNGTFQLSKTLLGTLEGVEQNTYDVIFANPPYYQEKLLTDEAKRTGQYTWNGVGIEALFLEWIVRSLAYGGIANIVLPDGLFSNINNKNLKRELKRMCCIESIISLPRNTFFNTSKKTYILTVKKKSLREIEQNIEQNYPVFCYICSSIGETLDKDRFDEPDQNDLHESVCKYNYFKNLPNKFEMQEPFKTYFSQDIRFKAISVKCFENHKSWIIENWWSDDEKVAMGVKDPVDLLDAEDLENAIEDVIKVMSDCKQKVKAVCGREPGNRTKRDDYEEVPLTKIIDFSITTNSGLTKKFVNSHPGNIPVYGASKYKDEVSYGYMEDNLEGIRYFENCLTYNKDGASGYVFYRQGRFTLSEKVLPLVLYDEYRDKISYDFLAKCIQAVSLKEEYSFSNKATKYKLKDICVYIPVDENGEFDIDEQISISRKYDEINRVKDDIADELRKLLNKEIVFQK